MVPPDHMPDSKQSAAVRCYICGNTGSLIRVDVVLAHTPVERFRCRETPCPMPDWDTER